MQDEINRYLRQAVDEPSNLDQARDGLLKLEQQIACFDAEDARPKT